LGLGFGGGGFGVWAQTPNPQSPIPNPQSPFYFHVHKLEKTNLFLNINLLNIIYLNKYTTLSLYLIYSSSFKAHSPDKSFNNSKKKSPPNILSSRQV